MKISIETDKGEYRHWYDPNTGEKGKTKFLYPYGYVTRGKEGLDGDKIDVFVGPNENSDTVYVIHQRKTPDFKEWDEDKVMLGFESKKDAKQAYLSHFNDDRFFGSMDVMSFERFKDSFVNKAIYSSDVQNPMQDQDPTQTNPIPTVDPYDVSNPVSVTNLLNNIATMGDKDLLKLIQEIWGNNYEYRSLTENQIRAEIRGFLRDQMELIEAMDSVPVGQDPYLQNSEQYPNILDFSPGPQDSGNLLNNQTSESGEQAQETSGNFESWGSSERKKKEELPLT